MGMRNVKYWVKQSWPFTLSIMAFFSLYSESLIAALFLFVYTSWIMYLTWIAPMMEQRLQKQSKVYERELIRRSEETNSSV